MKIILNCLLKSTQKPYNQYLWLNIISAENEKRKTAKKDKCNEYVDDYIIEYKLVFKNVNGENSVISDFAYKTYLSEFAAKEQSFIGQLINNEIKNAVLVEATVV